MKFGDGIDWDNEGRRAAAEDDAKGERGVGSSELIDRLAAHVPSGGSVLDAGCNIGRYAPLVRAKGLRYTGVDQSEAALMLAAERNPGARFIRSFLWDMAFEGERFDGVIVLAVLQHNTHAEKERILPRIAAALKPGGVLILSESTVLETTATQLTHAEWIGLVCRFGFDLIETWHPNPEYGIDDGYAFRRRGAVEAVAAPETLPELTTTWMPDRSAAPAVAAPAVPDASVAPDAAPVPDVAVAPATRPRRKVTT